METISAGDLIRILDKFCSENPGATLATDADGTLWSGDVGIDTFEHLIRKRGILAEAEEALRAEAREAAIQVCSPDVHDLAYALYRASEEGTWPEKRAYEMMVWAFAGWKLERVHAFVREALDFARLSERLHGELLTVLAWARKAGVPVRIVSASPLPVVQVAAEWVGLDPEYVIAAAPVVVEGRVRTGMGAPIPYAHGKVEALRAANAHHLIAAAFGDNVFDLEMLQIAAHPVAVRPKPRLLARAHEVAGLRKLEQG